MKNLTDDEFIKSAMRVVMQPKRTASPDTPIAKRSKKPKININRVTLSDCLGRVAKLIEKDGDVYLPIFERISNELKKLEHLENLKTQALNLARQTH